MRTALTSILATILLTASVPADARGGRGWGGISGWHGSFGGSFPQGGGAYGGGGWRGGANGAAAFSLDQKHGDDPHVKAASEEEERVLKKLNSICRGC